MRAARAGTLGVVLVAMLLASGCAGVTNNGEALDGTFHVDPIFQGEIFVREKGGADAPLVVLLHGLGGNADDFLQVQAELARSHRVLALDLPGFGRSSKPNTNYQPRRYVEALHELLHSRAPFLLVGHSMGASIAMLYAARHPRHVDKLVLIDAAGILHGSILSSAILGEAVSSTAQRSVLRGLFERALTSHEGEASARILDSPELRSLFLAADPNQIAALGVAVENFSTAIERVRAPTLVVWGEEDQIAPLRTGRLLAARIPSARLVVLPNVGHAPMKTAPEQTARLLFDFFGGSLARVQRDQLAPGLKQGRADGVSGAFFEGPHDTIEIRGSTAVLRNVAARSIRIVRSDVVIEDSRLISDGVALEARESKVELTNVHIEGAVAIEADASRIDLAGVEIVASDAALRGKRRASSIVFSVSRVKSTKTDGYLHGQQRLGSRSEL